MQAGLDSIAPTLCHKLGASTSGGETTGRYTDDVSSWASSDFLEMLDCCIESPR